MLSMVFPPDAFGLPCPEPFPEPPKGMSLPCLLPECPTQEQDARVVKGKASSRAPAQAPGWGGQAGAGEWWYWPPLPPSPAPSQEVDERWCLCHQLPEGWALLKLSLRGQSPACRPSRCGLGMWKGTPGRS